MMKGLLCQVRKASDASMAVGTLSLMANEDELKVLTCDGTAVTHVGRTEKAMAQFYWMPSADMGDVKVM